MVRRVSHGSGVSQGCLPVCECLHSHTHTPIHPYTHIHTYKPTQPTHLPPKGPVQQPRNGVGHGGEGEEEDPDERREPRADPELVGACFWFFVSWLCCLCLWCGLCVVRLRLRWDWGLLSWLCGCVVCVCVVKGCGWVAVLCGVFTQRMVMVLCVLLGFKTKNKPKPPPPPHPPI